MNCIFDVSFIGLGKKTGVQTGVYRTIDNILKQLWKHKNTNLQLLYSNIEEVDKINFTKQYLLENNQPLEKLITNPKKFTGLYNPYNYGNHILRTIYGYLQINNKGSILNKYLHEAQIFYTPFYAIPHNLKKYTHLKRVITFYDLIPIIYPHLKSNTVFIKNVINSIQNDYVITISEFSKNDLLNYQKNIEPNKVFVNYCGVDTQQFYPCTDKYRWNIIKKKYSIPDNYFLCLGTLEPRKNFIHIIQSFIHFIQQQHITNFHLVIVGNKGLFHQQIESVAKKFIKNIVFTGRVADEDLATIYANANSFYFMSKYEGFGLPPLEAMACGIPVVAANATSLPEVVGQAGVLLNPTNTDDLCQAMLNNYNHIQRDYWIQKGFERIQLFSWEKSATHFIKLCNTIVNS